MIVTSGTLGLSRLRPLLRLRLLLGECSDKVRRLTALLTTSKAICQQQQHEQQRQQLTKREIRFDSQTHCAILKNVWGQVKGVLSCENSLPRCF